MRSLAGGGDPNWGDRRGGRDQVDQDAGDQLGSGGRPRGRGSHQDQVIRLVGAAPWAAVAEVVLLEGQGQLDGLLILLSGDLPVPVVGENVGGCGLQDCFHLPGIRPFDGVQDGGEKLLVEKHLGVLALTRKIGLDLRFIVHGFANEDVVHQPRFGVFAPIEKGIGAVDIQPRIGQVQRNGGARRRGGRLLVYGMRCFARRPGGGAGLGLAPQNLKGIRTGEHLPGDDPYCSQC